MNGRVPFFLSTATAALHLFVCVIHADTLVAATDTGINYYGRFERNAGASSVKFNWPGSIIEASCPGPTAGIELSDGGAYFDVEIDGIRGDSLPPSSSTRRIIATNLSDSPHQIRIILRTNGQTCAFGGFYLANGKHLGEKPQQPSRKIEFIVELKEHSTSVLQYKVRYEY